MARKEDSIINRIAAAVAKWPGSTGAELSTFIGIPSAYRRLSEIEKLGLVKPGKSKHCTVSNKQAKTWFPDDRDPVLKVDRGDETKNQMERRMQARIEALVNENFKQNVLIESYEDGLRKICLLWNFDPSDGEGTSAEEVYQFVKRKINGG